MSTSDISPIEYESFSKSYYMISRLGFGSFGCAILAKYRKSISDLLAPQPHKLGTLLEPLEHLSDTKPHADGLVAIKVMKTQLRKPSDYLNVNEIKFILSVPSHPNLLQIFDLFIDSTSGKLNIVMEPMDQNLYQFIQKHEGRPISSLVIKSMLAQLLGAIRHIHSHGFFHRDVKPENILVSSAKHYYYKNIPSGKENDVYVLKLCDYGLSRHVTNTKDLTQYVSTRWYRAPEILLRRRSYSRPIDIWAFGSVAVELVNCRPLFAGLNETDQIWQILTKLGHPLFQGRSSQDLGGMWPEAVQLADKLGFIIPYIAGQTIQSIMKADFEDLGAAIQSCFSWDPDERPTADALSRHAYFRGTSLNDEAMESCSGPSSPLKVSGYEKEESYVHGDISRSKAKSSSLMISLSQSDRNSKPRKAELYSDPLYFFKTSSESSDELNANLNLKNPFSSLHATDANYEELDPFDSGQVKRSNSRFDDAALQADASFESHEISC
ncbi:hypothetical protein JCM33374_g3936 [Metschnikowia sp. JCM 33374]|nr:hypothetical protein JCM33374_g3936 [Metschnikowia sp. JCM 33374]